MTKSDDTRPAPKIRAVHAIPLEHRLDAPYGMARGLTRARGTTLVLLEAGDGLMGIGEAWGPSRVTAALVEHFREAFIGHSVFDVRPVIRSLWAANYHMGAQGLQFGALGGIDTAAWDLIGKNLARPVSDLIGGRARDRVLAYASAGYITERNEIEAFTRAMRQAHDAGFRAVKIKIGLGPASDAERVAIARDVMGDDAYILVDINGAYTVDTALRSMDAVREFDVHWFEEPLSPEDIEGYRRLRSMSAVTLAAGEAGYSRHALRPFVQERLVDVIQPDVNKIGGVTEMLTVRDAAEANNVRFSPHCWSGAVSMASTLQILATVTPYPAQRDGEVPLLLEYDQAHNPLRDELLAGTPTIDAEGYVPIPDAPGLGVELDRQALRRLAVPGSAIPEAVA